MQRRLVWTCIVIGALTATGCGGNAGNGNNGTAAIEKNDGTMEEGDGNGFPDAAGGGGGDPGGFPGGGVDAEVGGDGDVDPSGFSDGVGGPGSPEAPGLDGPGVPGADPNNLGDPNNPGDPGNPGGGPAPPGGVGVDGAGVPGDGNPGDPNNPGGGPAPPGGVGVDGAGVPGDGNPGDPGNPGGGPAPPGGVGVDGAGVPGDGNPGDPNNPGGGPAPPGGGDGAGVGNPGGGPAPPGGEGGPGAGPGGNPKGAARPNGRNNRTARKRNSSKKKTVKKEPPKKKLPKRELLPTPEARPTPVGLAQQIEGSDSPYLATADELFVAGKDEEALKYVYGAILSDDKVAAALPPSLINGPRGKTTVATAVRWGIGVNFLPPKGKVTSGRAPQIGKRPKSLNIPKTLLADGEPPSILTSPTAFKVKRVKKIEHTYDIGELVLYRLNDNRRQGFYGEIFREQGPSKYRPAYSPTPGGRKRPEPFYPGITYLQVGTERELLKDAEELNLDVMVVFLVKVIETKSRSSTTKDSLNQTSMKVYTVADGREVFATSEVNSLKVYMARVKNTEPDPVDVMVDEFFEFADKNFKVRPLPDLTFEAAKPRLSSLISSPLENPLPAMAELRYYHFSKVIDDEQFKVGIQRLTGDENAAAKLATGTLEEKQEALERWLPN